LFNQPGVHFDVLDVWDCVPLIFQAQFFRPRKSFLLGASMKSTLPNTTDRYLLPGILFVTLLGTTLLPAQDKASRVWTNQQGRTVKAALVEVTGVKLVP
jgi:hypothetical protein